MKGTQARASKATSYYTSTTIEAILIAHSLPNLVERLLFCMHSCDSSRGKMKTLTQENLLQYESLSSMEAAL